MSSIDFIRTAQKQLKDNPPMGPDGESYQKFLQRIVHAPDLLVVGCNDARLPVAKLGMEHGKGVILRALGAYLRPMQDPHSLEAAVVEFATRGKDVKDIIVMGHTDCNAMKCCLEGHSKNTEHLPSVLGYLSPLEKDRQRILDMHLPPEEAARKMEQAAVCATIENLEKTYPAVREAVAEGRLRIHGTILDIHKALADPPQPFLYELTDRKTRTFELMADLPEVKAGRVV